MQQKGKALIPLSGLILMTLLASCGSGSTETGWLQWRGPNGNGIIAAENFNPEFPADETNQLWYKMIGDGYSSMTVIDGKMYTVGRIRETGNMRDALYCIDTETGEALWTVDIPVDTEYAYPGPRAQPVLENGILYYVSPDAEAFAFKASNGKEIWSTDIKAECGATPPEWGISGSVAIEGDMLLINACTAGVALDKKNGSVIWSTTGGANGYSTPVVMEFDEEKVAAVLGFNNFYLVSLDDGRVKRSFSWQGDYSIHATDPMQIGENHILLSSNYGTGACLLNYSNGELEVVWRSDVISSQFSSIILKDGYIYGIDGTTQMRSRCFLKCIDPLTGEEIWSEKIRAYGSLIMVNDILVVLDEYGSLFTVKAQPEGFEQIAERRIFEGRGIAWIAPVYHNDRLYLRSNVGELVSVKTN